MSARQRSIADNRAMRYLRRFWDVIPVAIIVMAIVYCFYRPGNLRSSDTIILSSGAPGSAYYQNAAYIKNALDNVKGFGTIENIPSESSSENFERLESKNADLIIAKRSVVIEKYYQKDDAFKNFEIILPLFEEAMHRN